VDEYDDFYNQRASGHVDVFDTERTRTRRSFSGPFVKWRETAGPRKFDSLGTRERIRCQLAMVVVAVVMLMLIVIGTMPENEPKPVQTINVLQS